MRHRGTARLFRLFQLAVDVGKETLEDKDSTEQPEDGGMHPQLPELVTGAGSAPALHLNEPHTPLSE